MKDLSLALNAYERPSAFMNIKYKSRTLTHPRKFSNYQGNFSKRLADITTRCQYMMIEEALGVYEGSFQGAFSSGSAERGLFLNLLINSRLSKPSSDMFHLGRTRCDYWRQTSGRGEGVGGGRWEMGRGIKRFLSDHIFLIVQSKNSHLVVLLKNEAILL